VPLFVVRRHQILIDVPRNRLRETSREQGRIQECTIVVERNFEEARLLQRPAGCAIGKYTEVFIRIKRWIEADVLEYVVIHPVIEEPECTAHHELLVAHHVKGKAQTRGKVVEILVPDAGVADLKGRRCLVCVEGIEAWEIRIHACGDNGSYRRPEID